MTYVRSKAQERRFREMEAAYREDEPTGAGPADQVIATTEEAVQHIAQAIALLEQASGLADWGGGRGDLMHFTQRLREILSCDHDEAGLQPLLRLLRQKTH